jgi:ATP-dependent DNA helicase RecG
MDQLEYLRRYLWTYTQHGMTSGDGFQRVDIHEYPEVVIRELSINMLSHRDYWMPFAQARVMLFRNRIEWSNPGGLPEGITPENILRTQKSRNPTLQTILFEAGYTEGLGQGIDTVVAALAALDGDDSRRNPTFEDHGDSFIVTVYGRSHDDFYAEEIIGDLSKEQRRLLQFLRQKGEVSTPEIMKRLERSENSVHRDLKVLLNAKLIEAVGEARRRRYRLITGASTPANET